MFACGDISVFDKTTPSFVFYKKDVVHCRPTAQPFVSIVETFKTRGGNISNKQEISLLRQRYKK